MAGGDERRGRKEGKNSLQVLKVKVYCKSALDNLVSIQGEGKGRREGFLPGHHKGAKSPF